MRILCLTSLTKREYESSHMRQNQYDYYTKELEGCEKYALTELFVGKHNINFEFHVHREDIGVLRYLMNSHLLNYTKVSNKVIDVEISPNNGFGLQVFVKNLRIRCIKSNSSRTFTKEQKKYYVNYAKMIEQYANGDPERREAAFSAPEIPKFEYENEEEDNSRMSDLINAFNGLCEEEEKRVSARYDQFIDRNIIINYHSESDKRINYIKDFTKTKEIKLFRSNLSRINPKWFDATNLEILNLSCVSPFEFEDSWKVFSNGIKNCHKLKQLKLHRCGINEIPNFVFEALPISIVTLTLGENNLKELSPLISRLTNLESLSISFNPDLSDAGMPWEEVPKNLEMLDIAGTKIKAIPAKIERFKVLKFLFCGNQITYVKWKALPNTLEELSVTCGGRVNPPRSLQKFKKLRNFVLMNAGLKKRFFKHLKSLYRFVDLSGNNFQAFKCPNFSPDVSRLYLNHCQLHTVNWVDVWRVLPHLEHLQLRHNQITDVFPYPFFFEYSILTHLDLEDNQIENVCGEFLPTSLIYLDLTKNKISTFDLIDYLPQLAYLFIEENQLQRLPEGIEKCCNLKAVMASKNQISLLPEGFENLADLRYLNLSFNKFGNGENNDLLTCLWNRLPNKVDVVILSFNNLGELPCELSKKEILRLEADKCQLRHICPRLGFAPFPLSSHNIISIKLNDELENLSFVPTKIFFPPTANDEKQSNEFKGRFILISDRSFKDTTRWKTSYKIHTYDFIPKLFEEIETHACQCCARCGIICAVERGQIETFMVMDFTHIVETPSIETRAEKEIIDEYGPGEWKTKIKTKMCLECVGKMRTEVAQFYAENPLKHKKNVKKNRKKLTNDPTNSQPVEQNIPKALIPKDDNHFDKNNFGTDKIHVINSHIHQQHHNQRINFQQPISIPSQPSEQFVQTDNSAFMYMQTPNVLNAQPSYIYSTPGPSSSSLPPISSFSNTQTYYNYPNSQSYYHSSDVEMQNFCKETVFTNNMDENEFNEKAKLL